MIIAVKEGKTENFSQKKEQNEENAMRCTADSPSQARKRSSLERVPRGGTGHNLLNYLFLSPSSSRIVYLYRIATVNLHIWVSKSRNGILFSNESPPCLQPESCVRVAQLRTVSIAVFSCKPFAFSTLSHYSLVPPSFESKRLSFTSTSTNFKAP